jgi:hypothetical protein
LAERFERAGESFDVVGVVNAQHLPAVGLETTADVLVEGDVGRAVDGDVVVVVDPAQVRELEMPGERCRLACHALHHSPSLQNA